MKHVTLTLFAFLLVCLSGNAQTVFWTDDFEDAGSPSSGTRVAETDFGSGDIYFKRTNGSDIATVAPFSNVTNAKFWAGEDHGDVNPPGGQFELQIEFNNINITGLTNLQFSGKFAANNGAVWESLAFASHDDYIIVEYQINNSGTWVQLIRFYANNGVNKQMLEETTGDNLGEGTLLTHTLTGFTKNITGTGTEIDLRIRVYTNGTNEEWAIDNFQLMHTPSCTAPNITAQPAVNSNVCTGGTRTIGITATGATTYQWQVDATGTGSGPWTDLTNTGFYSGVTTNTLTITGANATINGYDYRCKAINGAASCFTNSSSSNLRVSTIDLNTYAQSNVSCRNGSNGTAVVIPSGGINGTAPGAYTYSWSPSGGTSNVASGLAANNYTVTVTDAVLPGCTAQRTFNITQPATSVSATATVTNLLCNGVSTGSINLTPAGGTPGYFVSWGGGVFTEDRSSLPAGTYNVIVEDANGCQASYSYTVTQPPALNGSTTVTNVTCNGGTTGAIDLTPSGGTPGYTYNWGGGVTTQDRSNIAAGAYSVVITDANACTRTVNATVTQPAAIGGTSVVTNVACFGGNTGAINLTPTGGTGPYTFNWGSGITSEDRTNLTAGTYSVTITDANACTGTVNITVTQPTAVVSGTTVVTNVACFGGNTGAINLTPAGGVGPYTFNWVAGPTTEDRTGLSAGTYSVTITDANGCTGTVSPITVTQPPSAVSGTTVVTNVSCFGGSNGAINLTPTGGVGPYTFNWVAGPTTEDRTGLTAGSYSVTITDANGCTGTVSPITVTQPPSAVSGTTVVTNVACFGNNTGAINLTPTGGVGPYTFNWVAGPTTEDRTGLTAGTYSVTITDANGCTGTVSPVVTQPAAAVSGTTVVTNIACFGGNTGAINLTPTGGVGPYTFDWGSGITSEDRTSLTTGTYSVTITDVNGCTGNISATVTQPTAPVSGTTVVTNVACFGGNTGAINLTPAGGVGPYTFNWVGGATTEDRTSLTAGTYSVTITDANGCTATVNATVTEPPAAVSGTTVVTNVSCFSGSNGTINLTPAGGVGPYTFSWVGGATTEDRTGLAAGTYSVTITDANGCTGTVSPITVTQPAAAISASTTVTNIACFGNNTGSINLLPAGGTGPYTFSWADGPTTEDRTNLTAGTYTVTITDDNGCTGIVNTTVTQPAAALSGSTVVTDIACFGNNTGAINLTPAGGTAPYTFEWGGGITTEDRVSLTAGTYNVTITDNYGCTATVSATVTEPAAAVSGTTVVTNVSCFGGSNAAIDLTPSGGVGPYTFSWVGGITTEDRTGLAAGSYNVTITDANGCTGTVSATVTEPAALNITPSQTDVSCNGGSNATATATVTGGTGTYDYSWSPAGGTAATATGLGAGTYTVTVTDDNSCQATQSYTITEPTAMVVTASQTDLSCFGGSNGTASVSVSGGTPDYTYSWSPSGGTGATASGLAAGTYTVTITDANSCTATETFTLTQPAAALTANANGQANVSCNGLADGTATVTATGGTGDYDYFWSPSGETGATATGLAAGTHTVTVTDENGCTASEVFTITQPDALAITATHTDILCNGDSTGAASVTVTGGTGTYTYEWSPEGGTDATASNLLAGTYTVTVTDQNGCTETETIIIDEPTALVLTAGTQTNVSCHGYNDGGASVAVTGGTPDYTYSWEPSGETNDTVTTLLAGENTVYVTDVNGCMDSLTFTITEPDGMTITSAQTNVSCFGENNGSASIEVTGGAGNYTYDWDPSGSANDTITDLTAGTYTVTVTDDNGCEEEHSITITQPDAITFTQTAALCEGESINVGDSTYSAPGTYTNTLTAANGCDSTVTTIVTVTVLDLSTTLNGGTASADQNGADYQWIDCANNQPVNGATSQAFTPEESGNYAVIITMNGCSDTSDCVNIINTSGVNEIAGWNATLYPNPSNGSVTVDWGIDLSAVSIEVTDVTGKVVQVKENLFGSSDKLELNEPRGIYYVRVSSGEQQVVLKLVLND